MLERWAMRPDNSDFVKQVAFEEGLISVEERGSLSGNCEPFPGKRVILVTVNRGYFDMFTNWWGSAKPFLGATEHLHVVAEDEEVVQQMKAFREQQGLDFTV